MRQTNAIVGWLAAIAAVATLGAQAPAGGGGGQPQPAPGGAPQAPGPAGRGGGRGQQPPQAPREAAPFDLTGQWVSLVTEDWQWRMVTPQKGDYASIPLNPEGRKTADGWDLAKDKADGNLCKAFGAAGLMRLPLRMRISWQDDQTLKLETDAGTQTRLLRFNAPVPDASAERTWQGISRAAWYKQPQGRGLGLGRGGGAGFAGGNLRVTTTHMRAGYLRKNGVPYSEDATLMEYFNRHDEPNGDQWITLTRVITDPRYLNQNYIVSESFKKESDTSKWAPTPCEVDPPRQ
jgi:hypothetical protein